jgi:hypothetical protein
MTNPSDTTTARTVLRLSPWVCGFAAAGAALTFIWVRAPLAYLLWSVAFGVACFVLTAVSWRARHAALYLFLFFFIVFGHKILRDRLMHDQDLATFQGMFVTIAVLFALMTLLRRWLHQFARLETSGSGT